MNTDLGRLAILDKGQSRAINAENPTGEKGKGGMASSHLGQSRKGSPCIPQIAPGETAVLADIVGAGVIEHIWMTVTNKTSDRNPFVLRDLVIRMYWDNETIPSVEAPLGDFFCCGFAQGTQVNSIPVVVIPNRGMNCYWAMPFRKHARITIENQSEEAIPSFFYQIDYCKYDSLPDNSAYFHAQWRRQRITEKAKDFVVLDGVKGAGRYVGTYLALTTLERYWWGEGEMKFFIDGDDEFPTICGTGTEDYFGGAWSFATYDEHGKMEEITYCTPYMGYPYHSKVDQTVTHPCHDDDAPTMRGFYRWHLPDPVRFASDLKVTLQQIGVGHRGLFERQDDVATIAYWYQTEPHNEFPAMDSREERWPR
ncbi:glycoside hydrolase family 172 protein [Paenibacillus sp. FSL R10-2734]|uniref:glycoside hydrolase family 172 protein n=1 Tax=Paenibacillus sp. FSL R10-2734 TaxID=2954691 RepID=UPI0030DC3B8A